MRRLRTIAIAAIIACTGMSLAGPVPSDVSTAAEYDYAESDDDSLIYQQMISPNWRTLPKELFGPEYVWDTKGFPRRVEEPQALLQESHSSSTVPQKLK
jgi:hypothetical protein